MQPKTEKLSLLEMYKLTQEILSIANSNPAILNDRRRERSSYFEGKAREHLERKKTELQYLIDTMEYQISHYYPRQRPIFMPRAAVKEYQFGKVREIIPPQRWEEPLVQYFLGKLEPENVSTNVNNMANPDDRLLIERREIDPRFNNADIESNPVYFGIMNPDIRNAILQRKMTQKEYEKLERTLYGRRYSLPPAPTTTTALEVRHPAEIVPLKELERRLDNIPPAVLAVEAGLTLQTVKKHKQAGLSGQEIVDEGYMIQDLSTTGAMIHNLRRYNVPEDKWGDVIDTARELQLPVVMLLGAMKRTGANDIEDIFAVVDEMESDITEFAEEHRMIKNRAWYIALSIYSGDGRGDVYRTLDILTGQYWDKVDEEAFSDVLKRAERN